MKTDKEELKTLIGDVVKENMGSIVSELTKKKVEEEVKEEIKKETEEKEIKVLPVNKEDELETAQKEADSKNWNSFGEFLKSVWLYRGGYNRFPDNRLLYVDSKGKVSEPVELKTVKSEEQILKTMTEGTDSSGGFLVPEQYRMEIHQIKLENSVIRPNGATVYPMTSDTLNIPRIDDTSHASTVYGGVKAYWTEEAGTKTESEPKWGNCKLTAHELAGYTRASNSLIQDNVVALERFLKTAFGEAWAYYEEDAFINGTGVGEPLGILNSGALISQTRTDTNNITFADIPNMWGRLLSTSRPRAIWLMNQEVEKDLFKAGFSGATIAAGDHPIFISYDQGATKAPSLRIFGRPYFVTEKMAALGSAGDFGLFDLSYYIIGDRSPLAIDTSAHVGFTSNTTYWRFTIRVDGQPWLQSPLTPAHGTDTIGPFVALSSTS